MKETCFIHIGSPLVGFWLSTAILLSNKYKVIIVKEGRLSEKLYKLIEAYDIDVVINPNRFQSKVPLHDNLHDEVEKYENKYNNTFSMLLSHYRNLGKGYITNVDYHPDSAHTYWEYDKKINHILDEMKFWEKLIEKNKPKFMLSVLPIKVIAIVSEYYGCKTFGLNYIKFGNRLFWSENEYFTSSLTIEKIQYYMENYPSLEKISDIDYEYIASSKYTQGQIQFGFFNSCKEIFKQIYVESKANVIRMAAKWLLKRELPKKNYPYLAWLKVSLNKPKSYNFFCKNGVNIDELKNNNTKYVYIPLHMEPEVALMQFSPEFTNSTEMIVWLSKSIPVNHVIVVKEAPGSFGTRSLKYYEKLLKIPNVRLAHPDVHTWDWAKSSEFVSTITGTCAVEAVFFKKPVVSFGKHQIANYLPTVFYASDFQTTRDAVRKILAFQGADDRFEISKEVLYRAIMDTSFDPQYSLIKLYRSSSVHLEEAKSTLEDFFKLYPEYQIEDYAN
jgi:hypothetical protein